VIFAPRLTRTLKDKTPPAKTKADPQKQNFPEGSFAPRQKLIRRSKSSPGGIFALRQKLLPRSYMFLKTEQRHLTQFRPDSLI